MKKLSITIGSILLIATTLFAQKIKVKEENENLGGGSNPALVVVIYETDENTVEKAWRNFMKKYDAKVSNSGGEIFADNALIKDISTNTMDIYAKTKKEDNGTKLIVAINMGGAFMSPSQHGTATNKMEKMLEDFARNLAKESIADQQKLAEKELEKLTRKQEHLVKDNEGLHNDIEKYKDKIQKAQDDIKKAEDDITKNLKDQEEAKKAMEVQKKVVETVKEKANKVD